MIRLTVLYSLPEGADEEEYVAWRQSTHQEYVQSMPGVLRSDFCRVTDSWPTGVMPAFRFQTTVDWPDRKSFDLAFFDETAQAKLRENLQKIGEYSFVVSEIVSE